MRWPVATTLAAALLVLPLASLAQRGGASYPFDEGCRPEQIAAAPITDDKAAWQAYLGGYVPCHLGGVYFVPYIYRVPARDDPADPTAHERLLDKAMYDVRGVDAAMQDPGRGQLRDHLMVYAGADATRTADLIVAAFDSAASLRLEGLRVVFYGDLENRERVRIAVERTGAEYVFVQSN